MEPLYRALASLTVAMIAAMGTSHLIGTLFTQWGHWLLVVVWTKLVVAFWGLVSWVTWGLRVTYHVLLRALLFYLAFYLFAVAFNLPTVGEVAMDALRALGLPIDPDTLVEWLASFRAITTWLGELARSALARVYPAAAATVT